MKCGQIRSEVVYKDGINILAHMGLHLTRTEIQTWFLRKDTNTVYKRPDTNRPKSDWFFK